MLHLLHHRELGFGLGDNGDKLIVGHVDGTLELRGVLSAEGWWLAIGPVQDGLRGTDTVLARCPTLNEPCLNPVKWRGR
jgi:hypothetical protein